MPKAKRIQHTKLPHAVSVDHSDDYTNKNTLLHNYADWYYKHLIGDTPQVARARQTLLAHALKHHFISQDDGDTFNMWMIKTKLLNGFFDPEFNAECIKHAIHYAHHLSTQKDIVRNPALAYFLFVLYKHCDENRLSFNLLERAHRKLTTRTLSFDQNRLTQIASSAQKMKAFVTELNHKDD